MAADGVAVTERMRAAVVRAHERSGRVDDPAAAAAVQFQLLGLQVDR